MRSFILYPLRVMINPVRGFNEIKYENKGSMKHVAALFLLMLISYTFRNQYIGFALAQPHPLSFDIIFDFTMVIVGVLLFCAGNWSITCLMDGKGKFKEIVMCMAYSFTPMIIMFIPATLISNFIIAEEAGFYYIAIGVSVFWFILMLFTALIVIHEFSFGKMLFTAFLTIIAILLIVFVIGLIMSMLGNMIEYFQSIYREVIYRL